MNPWEFHPSLVHFPIALLLSGVAVDFWSMRRPGPGANRVSSGLLIAGVATAVVAAMAGVLAFYTVPKGAHTEEAHHLVLWHIGVNATTVVLFGIVAWLRWRSPEATPGATVRVLEVVAALTLLGGSYLGGSIVYHGGMGVDAKILLPELQKVTSRS